MKETVSLEINRKNTHYSIDVSQNILKDINNYIPKKTSKVLIISHQHLLDLYGDTLSQSLNIETHSYCINQGESEKSWNNFQAILEFMLQNRYDRNALIIALGGGVIGDIAGFVSSVYQRGIKFIQIPTTLLSMVDSSVGGKTAVNLGNYGKNLIGAFYQPHQVVIDLSVLESLPEIEWKNGLAEVLKYAFINQDNGEFYKWLLENKQSILNRDNPSILIQMIKTSVSIKKETVQKDEEEKSGLRALLNLGHTFGHALETLSKYSIPHGQAVSIGIYIAAAVSKELGYIATDICSQIHNLLKEFNLTTALPKDFTYTAEDIYDCFQYDKKTQNNTINFVLPKGKLSYSEIVSGIEKELIINVLRQFTQ